MNPLSQTPLNNPSNRIAQPKFQASSARGAYIKEQELLDASYTLANAIGARNLAEDQFHRAEDAFNQKLNQRDMHNHDTRVNVGEVLVRLKSQFGTQEVVNRIQQRINEACGH